MVYERSHTPNTIAGFTGTTPTHHHLRSISFDHSYLPPPPVPPKNRYTLPQSYSHAQQLYPIVSTWSSDSEDEMDYHLRPRRHNPYLDADEEEGEEVVSPMSMTPMMESIFSSVRENSKCIKRKISRLSPRKGRSREKIKHEEDDAEGVESGVYDPQPSEWSSSSTESNRSYSQWEAIRLRVSIYLYWKRQALARKLTLHPNRS